MLIGTKLKLVGGKRLVVEVFLIKTTSKSDKLIKF